MEISALSPTPPPLFTEAPHHLTDLTCRAGVVLLQRYAGSAFSRGRAVFGFCSARRIGALLISHCGIKRHINPASVLAMS